MFSYLKFRYSFIFFLSVLAVLSLEAPALKSYSAQEKTFFMEELEFYWQEDKPGLTTFLERTNTRLPKYKLLFEEAAEGIDVHWSLIAAISYQESHWNPKAISDTGVRGMMMLTQKTAKEMGINKRTNPEDSIFGGANYFQKTMNRLPSEMSKLDKIWMSLAAYNLGYRNLELARDLAKSKNLDPNDWSEVSLALEDILKDRYGRESEEFVKHDQVMKYVKNVSLYYKTLSILYKEEELLVLANE